MLSLYVVQSSLWNLDPDKDYTHWPESKQFEMGLLVALNSDPDSDPSIFLCPVSSFHNQGFLPLGFSKTKTLSPRNYKLMDWAKCDLKPNLTTGLVSQDKMVNFPENY